MEQETKICTKCGEEKPKGEFVKNKNCRNGITRKCLECKNKEQLEFRIKNRNYVNTQAKKYGYKKYPEREYRIQLKNKGLKKCSKCGNIYNLIEFLKNESICFECRTGHKKCVLSIEEKKERRKLTVRKWQMNNPDKVKEINKKSRTKPENKIKAKEYVKKMYHLDPFKFLHSKSRIKYQKSEKAKISRRKANRKWEMNNKLASNIKQHRYRNELRNYYIICRLKRNTSLSTKEIKLYPELIEQRRTIIKAKRIINQLKPKDYATS